MTHSFRRIKGVLIDMSGTLHIDNYAIAGSQIAIKELRNHGYRLRFVTNTTKESVTSLCTRLQNINFDITEEEIFSSLTATKALITSQNLRPYLMLSESAKKDFSGIDVKDPNVVVVGLSTDHFEYSKLNDAFRILMNGASLIAINKARYYKRSDGLALAAGAFVSALEFSTGIQSIVVGKPEKQFFMGAAKSLECSPEECVMIGDDYQDDIEGALKVGMNGILVKTGKYLSGDENKISVPGYQVAKDFASAVKMLLSNKN